MIVTGDPGSGKTAVLGLLAALADPRRRPTVPRDGLPAAGIPRPDAIDVAIYAGNLTTGRSWPVWLPPAGIDDIDPDPAAAWHRAGPAARRAAPGRNPAWSR